MIVGLENGFLRFKFRIPETEQKIVENTALTRAQP